MPFSFPSQERTHGASRRRHSWPAFSICLLVSGRATVTLVAPQWPAKPWWPDLIRMTIDKPIKLPNRHSTLQAIGTNEFSEFPDWNLAIFRISGAPSALVAAQTH